MTNQHSLVPGWIYSFADYRQMFDLTDADLSRKILDYPGGITSFNAEMYAQGHRIISADSLYHSSLGEIQEYADTLLHADESYLQMHKEILKKANTSMVQEVLRNWHRSLELFLQDYPLGKKQQRYQDIHNAHLPFEDRQFNLLLCTALFAHTEHQQIFSDSSAMLNELCRVAEEVRVFPLLNPTGKMSEELGPLLLMLQQQNFGVEVREVPFQQLKGGNAMLRVWSKECVVA